MCPFNHDGACTIYPVRPSVCRLAHAIGTNEHCGDARTTIQTIKFPEVSEACASQQGVQTLLHAALRTKPQLELLPKAVMRRLSRATAFPNQPCPCGSGQKFKSCCRAD
jgi:Fe-S-cluster containining protein